jgi:hypothetical protein
LGVSQRINQQNQNETNDCGFHFIFPLYFLILL